MKTGLALATGKGMGRLHAVGAVGRMLNGPAPHPLRAATMYEASAGTIHNGLDAPFSRVLPLRVWCRRHSFNATVSIKRLDSAGRVHLVAVSDDEGDRLLLARVRLGLLDEVGPNFHPLVLALGQPNPVEARVEAHEEKEIFEPFGSGLERTFGICRDALQRALRLAGANFVMRDAPRLGHEARPTHRARAGKRQAILRSDVLEVPVIVCAMQLKQQLQILLRADRLRRSGGDLRRGGLKAGHWLEKTFLLDLRRGGLKAGHWLLLLETKNSHVTSSENGGSVLNELIGSVLNEGTTHVA